MSLLKKNKHKEEKSLIIVQENQEECSKLIEQSFLKDFLKDSITDISYNGTVFYALDNDIGRYKLDINVDNESIYNLIKKIANYMLKPFSIKNPILDVSFNNFRLSAVHPLVARCNNQKVITFSLRMIAPILRIKINDPSLCMIETHELLKALVKSYNTILISGQTGSGKTELQKYLISFVNSNDRLIIIEESYETHLKEIFPNLDITTWLCDTNEIDKLSSLIRLSLRNNPDWLIIAETRGQEAYDVIQAAMTGHSAITTIHSESCEYTLDRIIQLCKKKIDFDEKMMLKVMAEHLKIGIHMEKVFDENQRKFIRRINEICEYVPEKEGYSVNVLYQIKQDEKGKEKVYFGNISLDLKKCFIKHNVDLSSLKKFIKKEENKNEKKQKSNSKLYPR